MQHALESPLLRPLASRRATIRLAREVASSLQPGMLWLLDGPLGAGKTFFVRALLRALGVPSTEPVASPTFGLVHRWETGRGVVLHADLYRLRDLATGARDVHDLGLDDARRQGGMLLVEWGQGFDAALGGAADGYIELFRDDHRVPAARSAELRGPAFTALRGA